MRKASASSSPTVRVAPHGLPKRKTTHVNRSIGARSGHLSTMLAASFSRSKAVSVASVRVQTLTYLRALAPTNLHALCTIDLSRKRRFAPCHLPSAAHLGAWLACRPNLGLSTRYLISIARGCPAAAGLPAVFVPFPAAVDDAVAIYRTLLGMGMRAEDIIFAGDSAGGGLAIATLLALRDAGDNLPAAAVLLSPFLDVTGSGDSMRTRADKDPWFRAEDLPIAANHYCEPHQQRFPLVSPVFADVEGLPPVFIQVGDDEILLSDSERLADACTAAGVDVELQVWPEMWHVFQMFAAKMPESRQAIAKMGAYIQSRF